MKYSSVRKKHVGSNVKSGKTLVKRKPVFNPKSRVQRKVIVNPSPVKRKITSAPDKNMRLTKDIRWAVVDVETTGVGTGVNGRVVQIAIDVYEGRKKVDSFISYVNPRCKIPSGAYRVHKIGYSQVKNAPTLQQLEGKIKNKLRNVKIIVGQNAAFDMRIMRQNGVPIDNHRKVHDTMLIGMQKYNKKMALDVLSKRLKVKVNKAKLHDAGEDIRVTGKCYMALMGYKI